MASAASIRETATPGVPMDHRIQAESVAWLTPGAD